MWAFSDSGSPVYFYEFQHPLSSIADLKPDFVKADHGDEISFVFGTMFIADEISSGKESLVVYITFIVLMQLAV